MTRIQKHDRTLIRDKAVLMAVKADTLALDTLGTNLADAFHKYWMKDNVSPADRKLVEDLSSAFVKSESNKQSFYIYLKEKKGDEQNKWTGRVSLPVAGTIKIPAAHSMNQLDIVLVAETKLAKQFSEYQAAKQALNKKRQELSTEIGAVSEANLTVKKLLSVWPEVRELIPDSYLNPPKAHLPAFNPAKLNNIIGLPSEKKAKAA